MSRKSKAQREAEKAEAEAAAAAEREQRIDLMVELILGGADARTLRAAATQEGWKVERPELDQLIIDAQQQLLDQTRMSSADSRQLYVLRLESLYRRAVRAQQFRQAAEILTKQQEADGLHRKDRGAAATDRARALPDWMQRG